MPVTATAYTYNELTEDAQKTAVDKSRYVTTEHFEWWDWVYVEWKEKLASLGFIFDGEKDDIFFSGFYSQGDGASFQCSVNVRQFLKAHKLANEFRSVYYWSHPDRGEVWAGIVQSGHYYHAMTMQAESEFDVSWETDREVPGYAEMEELEKVILEEARDYAKEIYKELGEVSDDMMSDEYVADHLVANDYLFWSNGHPACFH